MARLRGLDSSPTLDMTSQFLTSVNFPRFYFSGPFGSFTIVLDGVSFCVGGVCCDAAPLSLDKISLSIGSSI